MVTAQITDPSILNGSVFLVQVSGSGMVVATLGELHDDGANGDKVAGDKIFTAFTAVPDSVTSTLTLKVSAAFRGMVRRVFSDSLSVSITAPEILKDLVTNVQVTAPNFGVPSQLTFSQPTGEDPLLELKVFDPQRNTVLPAFGISLVPNPSRLSLLAWFSQNVDPDGILLSSGAFVSRTLANGLTGLVLIDAIPPAYQDGPVDDGYLLSASGDTVVIITTSHVNPLNSLGYSAAQIREMARRILGSVQLP